MNVEISKLLFITAIFFGAVNGLLSSSTPSTEVKPESLSIGNFNLQNTSKTNEKYVEKKETLNIPQKIDSKYVSPKSYSPTPSSTTHFINDKTVETTSSSASDKSSTATDNPVSTTTTIRPVVTYTTVIPTSMPSKTLPEPDLGKWIIRNNETNTTCIICEMAMQLNVTYPSSNGKLQNLTINVPKNSSSNGSCSELQQSLTVFWGEGHSLQINFLKNDSVKDFYVSGFSLFVNASVFRDVDPNVTNITYKSNSSDFKAPLDMSYKCNKKQNVNFTSVDNPAWNNTLLNAVLTISKTQLEAFMNNTQSEFGSAQDCDAFDTPDIVPIAVGCALAILVLVVLVAYLIGRKRSQNRGYLSM